MPRSIMPESIPGSIPDSFPVRYFVFSFVALVVGLCYALGTYQAWAQLSVPKQEAA
jgi:hypothetical protein